MTAAQCIGEPISWLRLERFALAGTDAQIRDHVAACPACKQCLDDIQRDVVALPPLPAIAPRRRWWTLALPIAGALAAAAIALVIIRPRAPARENIAHVKGLGEVVVDVVRERGGTFREDVRTFAAGDRWKVVVTCALAKTAWLDVGVVEDGARSADYPLAPAQIACGNRVVIPGAFRLTGDKPNRVCVHVATAATARPTALAPGDPDVACVTLRPE
ncbi:MAG: hypothetical protein HOV81_44850 [Kofleriaceae bacterium]|nr:hypothetical protein [Kofleriaceae bacterium]